MTTVSGTPAPAAPVPATVVAAVVVTWMAAAVAAGVALILLVGMLVVGEALLSAFDGGDASSLRVWVYGSVAVVVLWATTVGVLAGVVLGRRGWARWALIAAMLLMVPVGVATAYAVLPAIVAVAGIAVIVLLLLPSARSWFRLRTSAAA